MPRVGRLSLADNSHMAVEMGGQQIQSLCLGCGDVSLGQFTLTMSLFKNMLLSSYSTQMILGRVSHDHSVFVAVCRGNACVYRPMFGCFHPGSEVQLKYSSFKIKSIEHFQNTKM